MEEMEQDTKQCPFCGGEIKKVAIKCRHCGKFLNQDTQNHENNETISIDISEITKYAKFFGKNILLVAIIVLLCWILFFDYSEVIRNKENFWYGQYLSAGILHSLLLIWATMVYYILKK